MKAFTENITEYFVQVETVCTRPSSGEGGREGTGNKAIFHCSFQSFSLQFCI